MTSDTITAPAVSGLVISRALNNMQQGTLTDAGSYIQVEGLAKSSGATNTLLKGRKESQGNNAANAAAVEGENGQLFCGGQHPGDAQKTRETQQAGAQLKVILSALTAGPKDLHADIAYGMLTGQDMLRSSTQA
jgi:hypothetical protein